MNHIGDLMPRRKLLLQSGIAVQELNRQLAAKVGSVLFPSFMTAVHEIIAGSTADARSLLWCDLATGSWPRYLRSHTQVPSCGGRV